MNKETIFNIDGSTASVWPVDASEAVRSHPSEWAREPWNASQRRNAELAAMEADQAAASPSPSAKNKHLTTGHVEKANV